MKLGVVEGVQAQMGLDVGTKGWMQQQMPSWENVTIDAYLCGPHLLPYSLLECFLVM